MPAVKPNRNRALLVVLALAVLSSPAFAEKTLWLVRPLYPGQDALVAKTEKALERLIAQEARVDSVIGTAELVVALRARKSQEVLCLTGSARCPDPIDAFVGTLGFERVMLIKGGQDEAGYKFEVASYDPRTGKSLPSEATNSALERALLGAVVKVYPATSTLEVRSLPPGATVFIDDARAGTTPLTTPVLPGEHVVRLQLKLHQPIEETLTVPFRGQVALEKALERLAAQIVVGVRPAGASIFLDGQFVAKDTLDRGIQPGEHVLRLVADGHKAFEQTITVKPEQQFTLDKALEPIAAQGTSAGSTQPANGGADVALNGAPPLRPSGPPPPPPPPPTEAERVYEQRNYFLVGFATANLLGDGLVGRSLNGSGVSRTERWSGEGQLVGAEAEFGIFGKYFGVSVIGLTFLTNPSPWAMTVGQTPGATREQFGGVDAPNRISQVQANLVQLRALQPQLRLCLWRFQVSAQLGLELRSGQVVSLDTSLTANPFKDGFIPIDLLATARVGLRFRLVEGLFAYAAGSYWHYLLGEATAAGVTSSSALGFNGGLGYGF
jgi:hypothetical protein